MSARLGQPQVILNDRDLEETASEGTLLHGAHYRVPALFSKATGLDPCQNLGTGLADPPA